MIKLLDYIFYKTSKFYSDWWESESYGKGSVYTFIHLGAFLVSIIALICYLFDIEYPRLTTSIILIPLAMLGIWNAKKSKYERLKKKYANEKNKAIKGWIVFFFYYILSLVLYGISIHLVYS